MHNNNHHPSLKEKIITLHIRRGIKVLRVEDILFVKSEKGTTYFYRKNREPLKCSKSMKAIEEELLPYEFYRCHRSYLINIDAVEQILTKQAMVLLIGNHSIPVSREKRKVIKEIFDIT